jgi:hypothetical protein
MLDNSVGRMLGSSGVEQRQLASKCEQSNETSLSVRIRHFSEDLVNSHEGLYPVHLLKLAQQTFFPKK